jgi:hypothetical protein
LSIEGGSAERELGWCWEPTREELAEMGPQEERVSELEAELRRREAVITDSRRQLAEAANGHPAFPPLEEGGVRGKIALSVVEGSGDDP